MLLYVRMSIVMYVPFVCLATSLLYVHALVFLAHICVDLIVSATNVFVVFVSIIDKHFLLYSGRVRNPSSFTGGYHVLPGADVWQRDVLRKSCQLFMSHNSLMYFSLQGILSMRLCLIPHCGAPIPHCALLYHTVTLLYHTVTLLYHTVALLYHTVALLYHTVALLYHTVAFVFWFCWAFLGLEK